MVQVSDLDAYSDQFKDLVALSRQYLERCEVELGDVISPDVLRVRHAQRRQDLESVLAAEWVAMRQILNDRSGS